MEFNFIKSIWNKITNKYHFIFLSFQNIFFFFKCMTQKHFNSEKKEKEEKKRKKNKEKIKRKLIKIAIGIYITCITYTKFYHMSSMYI